MVRKEKVCSRCILDETVPGIEFDSKGECNYCKLHDRFEKKYPLNEKGRLNLQSLVDRMKRDGERGEYDCVLGLSGGRDSTYMVSWAFNVGLRPYVVFYDSGWYSEQSKENIYKVSKEFGFEVETVKCDIEEYKDIQVAFLKGSTNDIDAPDDQAIISVLYKAAAKNNIKYILSGHSFRTEGNTPITWSYMDGRYVKHVHKIFGKRKIKSYPTLSFVELVKYIFIDRIKYVYPLEYVEYDKIKVSQYLKDKYGWVYSGGHHFDCQYIHLITKILREKFNIDKRKVEYSALIRSGQMGRETALVTIAKNPVPEDENLVKFSLEKLGLSDKQFNAIMSIPPKTFLDYKTYFGFITKFGFFIKVFCYVGIMPLSFYEKYVKLAKTIK